MGRRKDEGLLELLILLPWWVSVVASASSYIFLVFLVPILAGDSAGLTAVATGLSPVASIFSFALLVPAPFSYLRQRRKRRLLDAQKNSDSIRSLSWREFEELLAEAYRRKGYSVVENTKLGPDGGIDIRLFKDDQLHLVQCKHWKTQKVSVNVVREMLGLVKAESAVRGIVITSGSYTQEATKFALNQPLELIGAHELYELISSVQKPHDEIGAISWIGAEQQPSIITKTCPSCGSKLVARVARKGISSGNTFYGCASFPKCRYTEAAQG